MVAVTVMIKKATDKVFWEIKDYQRMFPIDWNRKYKKNKTISLKCSLRKTRLRK